jgi:hypothetical protein
MNTSGGLIDRAETARGAADGAIVGCNINFVDELVNCIARTKWTFLLIFLLLR